MKAFLSIKKICRRKIPLPQLYLLFGGCENYFKIETGCGDLQYAARMVEHALITFRSNIAC